MKRTRRKEMLIKELALFLTEDAGRKSIELQMEKPDAQAWARLRTTAGISGYATPQEAVEILQELL